MPRARPAAARRADRAPNSRCGERRKEAAGALAERIGRLARPRQLALKARLRTRALAGARWHPAQGGAGGARALRGPLVFARGPCTLAASTFRGRGMNTQSSAPSHPFQAEVAELLRLMVHAVYAEQIGRASCR